MEPNNLMIWDNCSVLHGASGRLDGLDHLLHRVMIS